MYRLKPVFTLFLACLISASVMACGDDDPVSEPPPAEEAEPRIRVDVSSLDFDAVGIGESAEQTAEIRNTGDGTLSGEVSLSGSAAFTVMSGAGSYSLGEADTRNVTVRFAPEEEGEAEAALEITHNADNEASPFSVPAVGEGQIEMPEISVDVPSLNFGTVDVGESAEQTVEIRNTGDGTLSGEVGLSGSAAFTVVSGGGSYSLGEADTRNVTVRFSPEEEGEAEATLEITHNADNEASPVSVLAVGEGKIQMPEISVDVFSLDFGSVDVGESADQTIEIRNTGDGTLAGEVSLSGSTAFTVVSGGGSYSLGEGDTRSVTVRFEPEDEGEVEATLEITHNADNEGSPLTIPVVGEGQVPEISVNVSSIDFGEVDAGESADQTAEIRNTGDGALFGEVTLTGSAAFTIVSGGGIFSLDAGATREVTVRFAPEDEGEVEANVEITHNANNEQSPLTIPVLGQGLGELPPPPGRP